MEHITCKIQRMFKNCPKANGWCGFVGVTDSGDAIALTGISKIILSQGLYIEAYCEKANKKLQNLTTYTFQNIAPSFDTAEKMRVYLTTINLNDDIIDRLIKNYGDELQKAVIDNIDEVASKCDLNPVEAAILRLNLWNGSTLQQFAELLPELSSTQLNNLMVCKDIHTAEQIQNDPYILYQFDITDFALADKIALRLGFEPLCAYRVNHGIVHQLSTMTGDMYVNLSDENQFKTLYCDTESLLNIKFKDFDELKERLENLKNAENSPIKIVEEFGEQHLYETNNYVSSQTIMDNICNIASSTIPETIDSDDFDSRIKSLEKKYNVKLNQEQLDAVKMALSNKVSIVTGGPGRGKTLVLTFVALLYTDMMSANGSRRVVLLAPTGKAAKRIKDLMPESFSDENIMTIDRLLTKENSIMKALSADSAIAKLNNRDTLVIVDETSMLDVPKAAALLESLSTCRFCFIGDADQLPSIGPGSFFNDLINSKCINTIALHEPIRNNGLLLKNADKIKNGDTNLAYDYKEFPFFPYEEDNEDTLNEILDCYNDERELQPDITQLILLSPMRKGITGTVNLNIKIHDIVCPALDSSAAITPIIYPGSGRQMYTTKGYEITSRRYGSGDTATHYRVGDIVINTKNCYNQIGVIYKDNDFWGAHVDSTKMGIYNGDCGRIIAYSPADNKLMLDEIVVVQLFDNRILTLEGDAFSTFELGYALTVHKAQGCEYDTVMYISPKSMLNCIDNGFACRNIVYTALTRAKQKAVIIGSKSALETCITHELKTRNSLLDKLIEDKFNTDYSSAPKPQYYQL